MLRIVKNLYSISTLWPKIRSDMDKYASILILLYTDITERQQLFLQHLVIFDYNV